MDFAKGHGSENDFVVLPDPDGALELTPRRVRALCDRRRGLGADGVLRVVPARLVPDAPADTDPAVWFMDYRNADGSVAEMCGNGLRLVARYLVDARLMDSTEFTVGTRSGCRSAVVHGDGTVTVGMGPVWIGGCSTAAVEGAAFEGIVVHVGNPHLVCPIEVPLEQLDLTVPPAHDQAVFPQGVNVEFVTAHGPGHIAARVHERGVGETRSCGTGTVAAAAAALHRDGASTGRTVVDTPGGRLTVWVGEGSSTLTGPAVLVARGQLDESWWRGA